MYSKQECKTRKYNIKKWEMTWLILSNIFLKSMKAVSISKKSCLPGKILHFCDQVITKLIMQIAQIIKKRWNFTHPCNIRIVGHKMGFYGPWVWFKIKNLRTLATFQDHGWPCGPLVFKLLFFLLKVFDKLNTENMKFRPDLLTYQRLKYLCNLYNYLVLILWVKLKKTPSNLLLINIWLEPLPSFWLSLEYLKKKLRCDF